MSEYTQPWQTPPTPPPAPAQSMTDTVAEKAQSVTDTASDVATETKQAAEQVAQTAGAHVQEVKDETVRQARDLIGETRTHVTRQAGEQHRALVGNLRSLSKELSSMVDGSADSGIATEVVGQARHRIDGLANWLDGREPEDILKEARTFAQRRPGLFLAGALAAGVVAGRVTRGVVAAHSQDAGNADSIDASSEATGTSTALAVDGAATGQAAYSTGGQYGNPYAEQRTDPTQGYGSTSTYGDQYGPQAGQQYAPQPTQNLPADQAWR